MDDAQNPPEPPVREGDVLAGKYLVEKVLGVGGMGVVVAAMHLELEERVALKFLQAAAAKNPMVVARFNREARAAAKIKSQHVARVIDVDTLEDGTPYIVMEHLDGKDLADILVASGPLPVGVAVDYVLQAGEAIAEAHAVGFVHRDLKPPNLFLAHQSDGSSIVKVLDFGISKAILDEPVAIGEAPTLNRGALTGTQEIFGSPTYMSPEQLKAARDVDARSDIWALGVILYELISGRSPFERPTVPETFGAILFEEPAPLSKLVPEVPEGLERVIGRCLAKDRDARLANVGALAKALFPFAATGSRASLERTSRLLRRAGITVESVAPPPPHDGGSALDLPAPSKTGVIAPPDSQTRTAWDAADQIPTRPARSRAPLVAALVAGVLVAAAGGFFALRGMRPTPAASAIVIATAVRDSLPETPPPTVTPTPVAQAAPASAPTTTTVAGVPSATPPGVLRGKLPGRKGKLGGPAGTASAAAAAKAPDDDGLNDRK